MKSLIQFIQNRSLVIKIFSVVLLAALFIQVLLYFSFRAIKSSSNQFIKDFIAQSLNAYTKSLGDPPQLEIALELSKENNFEIRFESNSGDHWSTRHDLPPFEQILKKGHYYEYNRDKHIKKHRKQDNISKIEEHQIFKKEFMPFQYKKRKKILIGAYNNQVFYLIHLQVGKVAFFADDDSAEEIFQALFLKIISAVIIIFIFTWLSIKKIISPLKILKKNFQSAAQGNLQPNYEIKSKNELGQLSNEFNTMILKLKHVMLTKEQLLLDISHEIRTPLTRIKLALELMAENQYKESIKEDINEIDTMLNELLNKAQLYSKIGEMKENSIHLFEFIESIASKYHKEAQFNIKKIEKNLIILGDQNQFKKVFDNLFTNSIKYSHHDSTQIEIIAEMIVDKICIKVIDNGLGIESNELPFIFEPFYRVEKSRSKDINGYGLGLSLCKKIIETHQGTISIESQIKQGTTVTILLPNKAVK